MKIILSQRVLIHRKKFYDAIEQVWYSYLKDHELIFLPNNLSQDFEALADEADCFIITGGDDSAIRRTTELKMATAMMKRQKPIVGVCHGCFLLVDVLGGKIGKISGHRNGVKHPVVYRRQEYIVNSYHGLVIEELHKSATPLAVDKDGNCEAWIDGNIAGIVWHPERMDTLALSLIHI